MIRRCALAVAVVAVLTPAGVHAEETPLPDPTSEAVFSFTDPEIVESSGLVAREGLFVTVNDSGDSARLFTVDPATGDTIGVTHWPLAVYDVEALAPAGAGAVWVGDIGDNSHGRETVQVHRVPFGQGEQTAVSASYELDYPDGRHDAEALLAHPQTGRLYVVSKDPVVGWIYELPEQPSETEANRLHGVGTVMGVATGGDFFPDGRHVMIRGYAKAVIYTWPDLEQLAEVDLPQQDQGEALAIDEDGAIYLSSEGLQTPVLRLDLPTELRNEVLGIEPDPEAERAAREAAREAEEADRPVWPWFFMGGMGLVVLYGAVRLVRAGFFREE